MNVTEALRVVRMAKKAATGTLQKLADPGDFSSMKEPKPDQQPTGRGIIDSTKPASIESQLQEHAFSNAARVAGLRKELTQLQGMSKGPDYDQGAIAARIGQLQRQLAMEGVLAKPLFQTRNSGLPKG